MRKIPATMATQHPDNALPAYWDQHQDPFISAYQEISEAVHCFDELNVTEYMWDWEGKHADAAVIDRLFSEYLDYFKKNQLGKEKFLTFRIPNIWEEKGYNLLQAMTVILSSEDFARDLKLYKYPLFEVILPMTESAEQLIHIQKLFRDLSKFKASHFTPANKPNYEILQMIPLTESVESQLKVGQLLQKYLEMYQKEFNTKPDYIRPFLARSDPALVSGSLATVIANKLAINQIYEFSDRNNMPVYPISGVGSLPFRGGLTPDTVKDYIKEYPGMRTVSLQSSFRYDHPVEKVASAVQYLEKELPKTKPVKIVQKDQKILKKILKIAKEDYQTLLDKILPDVEPIFASVPRRRDRRQHIGLLAYGRNMGSNKLPRAITYTAGMYSIGIPPELIGLGQTLSKLSDEELSTLKKYYLNLDTDTQNAAIYINILTLNEFAQRGNKAWQEILRGLDEVSNILGIKIGPQTAEQKRHLALSLELTKTNQKEKQTELINKMAVIRKSLG